MKLIASLSTEKDPEIARLNRENEELRAEITRLREAVAANTPYLREPSRLGRQGSVYGSRTPSRASSRASSALMSPSYSRPTSAFLIRTGSISELPSPKKHTTDEPNCTPIKYIDGRIVEEETTESIRYLKPTESSLNKVWTGPIAKKTTGYDTPLDSPVDEPSKPWWEEGRSDEVEEPDGAKVTFEVGCDADVIETLQEKSRLHDRGNDFYSSPAGRVDIRFDKQLRFLKKAHALAQDTLWHALRK